MIIKENAAQAAVLGKFFRSAYRNYKRGGGKQALEYLRQFKAPTHNMPLKDAPNKIFTHRYQRGKANISRGVRTSIGNMADNLAIMTEGVGGKGVVGNIKQTVKNTGKAMSRQIQGDLVSEVNGPVVSKGGKKFIKSKIPFLKDREVISQTGRGSYIVRKPKALAPVNVALGGSGASIGVASFALGDKEKPVTKRLQTAAADTALFTVGIPVGIASQFVRGEEQRNLKNKNKK